jgi:hypothetical protein
MQAMQQEKIILILLLLQAALLLALRRRLLQDKVEGIAEKEKQRKTGGIINLEEPFGGIRSVNNIDIQ